MCDKDKAMVGIYFYVDGKFIIDAVLLEQGEAYGDFVQHGGHYDYWSALTPSSRIEYLFKSRAYDAFPRGRVVYDSEKKKYILYADKCLLKQHLIKQIQQAFGITDAIVKTDEHYKCSSCNPHYHD